MFDAPKTYRVYCFDGSAMTLTGHFIEVRSDEGAIAKAQARGVHSRCEIWEGTRLVAQLGEALRA